MYLKFYLNVLLNLFNELWHIKISYHFSYCSFFFSPKKNQILRLRSGSDPRKRLHPFSELFPDEAFVLLYFNINKLQRHLFF